MTTVDVTNYGAVGDGTTDDTTAIRDAADAAAPDGTVYFPSGTYLVGSSSRLPLLYADTWDNLTWAGEDYSTTELRMAGGKNDFMAIYYISPDVTITGGAFEQLTLNLNGSNQNYQPGNTVDIDDNVTGEFTFTDCLFKDGVTNHIEASSGDVTALRCRFDHYGRQANVLNSRAGHAFAVNVSSTIDIDNCYGYEGYGSFVDISTNAAATVTVDECIVDGVSKPQFSNLFKINPGASTLTATKVHAHTLDYFAIYATPDTSDIGDITLDNVLIEHTDRGAIDFPAPGTLTLTEFQATDVDNIDFRGSDGVAIWTDDVGYDTSLRAGVHEVGSTDSGAVFEVANGSGTVGEVVRDSTTSGLGTTDGMTVSTTTTAGPISPSVPSLSEVGPNATTGGGGGAANRVVAVTRASGVRATTAGGERARTGVTTTLSYIDDFDGGLDPGWTVTGSPTTVASPSYSGDALQFADAGGLEYVYDDGTNLPTFDQGETLGARVWFDATDTGNEGQVWFRATNSSSRFWVELESVQGDLLVVKNVGGTVTTKDSASVSFTTDQTVPYDVEITDNADDSFRVVVIEDPDGAATTVYDTSFASDADLSADRGTGLIARTATGDSVTFDKFATF